MTSIRSQKQAIEPRDKCSCIHFKTKGVRETMFKILVDLSDVEHYPHFQKGYLSLDTIQSFVSFTNPRGTKSCSVKLGVVKEINDESSDVMWLLEIPCLSDNSTVVNYQPQSLAFNTKSIISNDIETLSEISSSTLLESSLGECFPDVGDMVLCLEYDKGEFNSAVTLTYHSD